MKRIRYQTSLRKFGEKGEKTGWTYIEIPAEMAQQLKPGHKKSFRVKGKLDELSIQSVALLPMGDGNFIIPINASMRKSLRKQKGAMLEVQLQEDTTAFVFNKDFKICLEDEPSAKKFFETLPASHQKYFSKWIDSAKTEPTKVKRIAMAVAALARQMGYGEMIREQKNLK
ncbi:MAG: YdeI/OmpD-associated family protein [Chitinophagaceae bacterium]|nr:DUF1905 domain-containing protein [Chitinophagaceae bacterium]HQV06348.1 YdeI/OmpD-associated family protein [Chitinophagaceae bacterium]